MAEITLPRWVITNLCMPGGRRQGKKPKLPVQERGVHVYTAKGFQKHEVYTPSEFEDLFRCWEYRFWAAVLDKKSVVAECRCCGSIGGQNIAARQLHIAQGGCSKRIIAAYKLLLRDERCVICNNKTHQQAWGVPLCGSGCKQAWCETEAQPKALADALSLIGDV